MVPGRGRLAGRRRPIDTRQKAFFQYVTRRHKRKKKKGSRTTYTVVTTTGNQRRLNTDELVTEMYSSESLSKPEKRMLKYEYTTSEDPRWQRKAKAKRLARNPWVRTQDREVAPTVETRATQKADQGQGAQLTCGPEQRQRAQSGPGHHRLGRFLTPKTNLSVRRATPMGARFPTA